ncbi:MAG: arsenite methyltransferase [Ignavibacteria bacterium]
MQTTEIEKIHNIVRQKYADIAVNSGSCCGSSCCSDTITDSTEEMGYETEELNEIPKEANMGLGCGNPLSRAEIKKGEVVIDLGSGGGIDCFLAAKQVGDSGKVIGVDMTPEMIKIAKRNAEKSGYKNVEFLLSKIENLPVDDDTADVIISNCVVNLSPDKQNVYDEVFRVLKPGGRLAISDMVTKKELPDVIKEDMELYTGCIAGASTIKEINEMLINSGFKDINITARDESRELIDEPASSVKAEDYIASAFIEAVKPIY